MTPALARASALALLLLGPACSRDESDTIVRAAQAADDAWNCPPESTRTFEIGGGRFHFSGCQRTAEYLCTGRPPACTRQK